jgi:hypothetical protein
MPPPLIPDIDPGKSFSLQSGKNKAWVVLECPSEVPFLVSLFCKHGSTYHW